MFRPALTALRLATVLAAGFAALAPTAAARPDAPARIELVVGFADAHGAPARARALREADARVETPLPGIGAAVVSVPAADASAALAELRAAGAVEYAARETFRTPALAPNDPGYLRQPWPYVGAGLPAAWDLTTGDDDVVVAVLDSGVDATHPDLPPLAQGRDFVNDDADPADDHGHGTAVAGAIVARFGNGIGGAGVCPACTVLPVKVLDGVTGVASDGDLVAGILWATDQGADVITISLGGPDHGQALQDAVAHAAARGVVVVAAAGNGGTDAPWYPAALPGVVGVSAIDARNRLYAFSNHGPHLDLAGPGCLQTTLRGGGSGQACGTSLSAPFVAAVAALVRARQPELTGAQVEAALVGAAAPAPGVDVGHGRVDARRALALADRVGPGRPAAATIAGAARVGARLAVRRGGDPPGAAPHRVTHQWQSCRGAAHELRCVDLSGATGVALVVPRSSVGARLRVRTRSVAADGIVSVEVSSTSAVVGR